MAAGHRTGTHEHTYTQPTHVHVFTHLAFQVHAHHLDLPAPRTMYKIDTLPCAHQQQLSKIFLVLDCMVPHTSVLLLIWPESQKLFYKKKFIFEKINVLVCINSKKKINCCYLTGKCKSKFCIFRHQNLYLFPLLQNIYFYFEIFDRASFLISLTS